MEDMLRIGVVTKPHGIRGEVKVYPTTDDIKRFDKTDEVILLTKGENMTLHVEQAKYFKNMVILKFGNLTISMKWSNCGNAILWLRGKTPCRSLRDSSIFVM